MGLLKGISFAFFTFPVKTCLIRAQTASGRVSNLMVGESTDEVVVRMICDTTLRNPFVMSWMGGRYPVPSASANLSKYSRRRYVILSANVISVWTGRLS